MSLRMGLRPVVVCSALLSIFGSAPAQTKVAVVDLQRAVLESAEIKKADADMQAMFQPRTQAATKLQQDITNIQQQLQNGGGKLTDQAAADLQAEGQRKQRELTRMNEDLQADAERYRTDTLTKSTSKMTEVVKKLAEEKGVDLVIDRPTALYFKPTLDLTDEAITAYNKAYPAAAPAAK